MKLHLVNAVLLLFVICSFLSCKGGNDDPESYKETYENGYYEGAFNSKGERDGLGIYYWNNGNKYEGYWLADDRSGKGTFTWKDGTTISCNWALDEPTDEKCYLLWVAKYEYLWKDDVNMKLDVSKYTSPEQLLESFRYIRDYYSQISTKTSEIGCVTYGFRGAWDSENLFRVKLVYPDTDADKAGIKRGWILNSISDNTVTNNTVNALNTDSKGTSKKFTFTDYLGSKINIVLSNREQEVLQHLYYKTFNVPGKKVGYWVIDNYMEYAESKTNVAITSIISEFISKGINELIVDCRYAHGGYYAEGVKYANLICPKSADNKFLYKTLHNKDEAKTDSTYFLKRNSSSLNLTRVIFITSKATDGVSEMIINGLKPYMNVITIGDKTGGTPCGGGSWTINNTDIFLITLKISNALGVTDFYDGLDCNYYCTDDLGKDFGDVNEECLKTALYYLTYNNFPIELYKSKVEKVRAINKYIQLPSINIQNHNINYLKP